MIASTINRLGTWFGVVALAVGVYDHTHSAIATASVFISSQFVPAALVPALVARVEMSRHKGALSALYLVEAASVGALAAMLLWAFWLPGMLLLVVLDGLAALAAGALLQSIAARIGDEDLSAVAGASSPGSAQPEDLGARRANAMLNTGFSVTVVLGPPIAGVVVATAGGPVALLIDLVSFVVCGILVLNLHPAGPIGGNLSVRGRLREAQRHLRTVPQLRNLLLIEFIALIAFESIAPVEVLYAKVTLAAGDSGYGFLMGSWGVGMVFGGLVFSRFVRKPLGPMLTGGTLAVGVAYLGLAASPTLLISCAVSVIGGLGNGVQWASFISSVQKLTPGPLNGRIMGAVQSMGALAPAIGLSVGGIVTATTSPRTALWVAGAAATASTIAFFRITDTPTRARSSGARSSISSRAPNPSTQRSD